MDDDDEQNKTRSELKIRRLGANNKVTVKDIPILQSSTTTVDTAHDLEVVHDSQLTMSVQVRAVCQSTHNYIHQLRPVVRALSVEARKTVVQEFVTSRLD